MTYDRTTRTIQNSKESSISSGDTKNIISHSPSVSNMKEGEQVYSQETNKPIALYKKHKGKLYKLYFSDNGNLIIDGNLNIDRNLNVRTSLEVDGGTVKIHNLPTSDPSVAGQLWNSSGTLKISAG
tara:strand:- start:1737 stop:2114 length:378 start_codon:yes stop_codon:yes gene_type:complete